MKTFEKIMNDILDVIKNNIEQNNSTFKLCLSADS
jgi:hypothetical protein